MPGIKKKQDDGRVENSKYNQEKKPITNIS